MDEEGGEKIDLLTGLLHALIVDASQRGSFKEEYYKFDEQALETFKSLQGIPIQTRFDGSSLEQAYSIWNQTPRSLLKTILGSVAAIIQDDYVQNDQFSVLQSNSYGSTLFVRYIPPTPFRDNYDEDND